MAVDSAKEVHLGAERKKNLLCLNTSTAKAGKNTGLPFQGDWKRRVKGKERNDEIQPYPHATGSQDPGSEV